VADSASAGNNAHKMPRFRVRSAFSQRLECHHMALV
jgi:hypothetical protein